MGGGQDALITVTANGKPVTLRDAATVGDLLAELGWSNRTVAVEHNGEALIRSEHPTVTLREGDVLEIVKAVAGG